MQVPGPRPAERNLESAAALAVDQAGGDMQDAVAQGGRFGGGEVVVQSQQPGPGEQDTRAPGQITRSAVDPNYVTVHRATTGVGYGTRGDASGT